MTISRAQMYRQLKNRGGIMQLEPRQQYGLGSLVKSVTGAVKSAVGGIKDLVSSDVGKLALLAAGGYYLGGGNLFGLQRATPLGKFAFSQLPGASLFTGAKAAPGVIPTGPAELGLTTRGISGALKTGAKLLTGSALIGSLFGGDMQQAQETFQRDPNIIREYLRQYYKNINPDADPMQVDRFVEGQMSEYAGKQNLASGGRVGFEEGGGEFLTEEQAMEMYPGMFREESGPSDLMELLGKYYTFKKSAKGVSNDTKQYFYDEIKKEAEEQGYDLNDFVEFAEEQAPIYDTREGKMGGGMPTGIMRTNQAGVMERDYREGGGFVPVGIKEKADDVPAMLSKNEFVMTADAVRGAGNGDVEKGAQRMYKVMKTLENGGTV